MILSNAGESATGAGLLQGSVVTMDSVKDKLRIEEPIRAMRRNG